MSATATLGNTGGASPQRGCAAGHVVEGFTPWGWRPETKSWFARLQDSAEQWHPAFELGLDAGQLRHLIQDNAAREADWLIHPCTSALTLKTAEAKLQCDLQLAVWLALHTEDQLGVATLDRPTWVWSPGGGTRLEPGIHDLSAIARRFRASKDDNPVAVDPWGRTIKIPFHQLWRDVKPFVAEEQATFKGDLMLLLKALSVAEGHLPSCFGWACSRTKVVVPLRRVSGEHSSSSSACDLPGVVFLTLHNEVQALDAFVHESAHQHLFMAETSGALIDPSNTALYSSPLRHDLRPLRGVLLAWHALAYIAAYYADALTASLAAAAGLAENLEATRKKLWAAQTILLENQAHLTRRGREFVDRTVEVAAYSA